MSTDDQKRLTELTEEAEARRIVEAKNTERDNKSGASVFFFTIGSMVVFFPLLAISLTSSKELPIPLVFGLPILVGVVVSRMMMRVVPRHFDKKNSPAQ